MRNNYWYRTYKMDFSNFFVNFKKMGANISTWSRHEPGNFIVKRYKISRCYSTSTVFYQKSATFQLITTGTF